MKKLLFALALAFVLPATASASGATTSADDFVQHGNVCRARTTGARAAVKELQRQLNRVARASSHSAIAEDGNLGPRTMALFRAVQSRANGEIMGDATGCMGVAPDADVLADQVRAFADSSLARG